MIPFTKSKDFEAEVLQAKVEFLGFKIEAGVAQRVMMSWILGGSHLPRTTAQFNDLLRKYRDQTMMQVLQEKQRLNEIYWGISQSNQPQTQAKFRKTDKDVSDEQADQRSDRRRILDTIDTKSPMFAFFNKVNVIRAETFVIKKLLD